MYAYGDPIVEIAMTHTGDLRECRRPEEVRAIANRVRGWGLSTKETCRSCQMKHAIVLDTGFPLCQRCQQHKAERYPRLASGELRGFDERAFVNGLIGHAVVFNVRSLDLGGFTEFISPQAVDRTLGESQPDVRALWNHDTSQPLGRTTAGTLALAKDTRGLKVGIDLPRSASALRESVERRDVSGMSFGFRVFDDEWFLEDGEPVRNVLSMVFHEVSPVSFPAYPATDLNVGSAGSGRSIEHMRLIHKTRLAR